MEYIQILKLISQWIPIIMGSSLFVLGVIGGLFNLVIFSRPRLQKTSCGQYIFVGSIFELCYISVILTSRVSIDGFNYSRFFSLDFVCKLRNYFGTFLILGSIWCKCLTAFDRWASTSRNVNIRQWNNIKRAHILLFILIILAAIISSPNIALSYSIQTNNTWQCALTNTVYLDYYAYFLNPIGIFLLPLFIFSFYGLRTYAHISHLNNFRRGQAIERQLTRMILYQVFITIVLSLPYGIQSFYSALTATWNKTPVWLAIDNIISNTGRIFIYLNSASSFYIYVSTSKEIRSMIRKGFKKLATNKHQRNSIMPLNNNENYQMQRIRT